MLSRARRLTKGAVVGATALAALVAALIGLAFDVWPSLRPDPRTQLGASVRVLALDRKVTLNEHMRRTSASEADYRRRHAEYVRDNGSAAGLAFEGELVYAQLAVRGFKGRHVTVDWSVYDARSKVRVIAPRERAQRTTLASLDAPTDEFIALLWIRAVKAPRRYFVRVEVNSGRTLLAMADSRPFAGLRRART